jgi:hypothetical protein
LRVLSRLSRNDALLLAAGIAIVAAVAAFAVLLGTADDGGSARPAATVEVIPLPRDANGNPALPNSTACSIGGKCKLFDWGETADMATRYSQAENAIRSTWVYTGGNWGQVILDGLAITALIPQVQAAAASYLLSRYCIKLRFPDPKNAYFLTAAPYGPRGRNGC